MITKGSKVKIGDNYSGNLEDVKGEIGTVIEVKVDPDPAVQNTYLLDVRGSYRKESYYYKGSFNTYYSNVIAFSDELEEYSYGMKDSTGALIEIGDTVVYSGNRPGIIKGVVVDFKDTEEVRWGNNRQVVKAQLEIEAEHGYHDGIRSMTSTGSRKQWFEHGSRMLIVQKNLKDLILRNSSNLVLHYGNE